MMLMPFENGFFSKSSKCFSFLFISIIFENFSKAQIHTEVSLAPASLDSTATALHVAISTSVLWKPMTAISRQIVPIFSVDMNAIASMDGKAMEHSARISMSVQVNLTLKSQFRMNQRVLLAILSADCARITLGVSLVSVTLVFPETD